ncbi:MAG: hypothetical protein J6X02_03910 [Bacilli bacterium]|nr:hypothetical protein [Bacilli bacterium]
MKNKILIILLLIIFNINVSAEEIVTVSSKVELNDENLSSESINKSALYIKNGDLLIKNSKIMKTGDGSFDNTNNYLNSAVTVYEKSKLTMNNCDINTNGTYANGILFDKDSKNNITKTNIITNNHYSVGIINNDANTKIDNVNIETNNSFSPAIRALDNKLEIINSHIVTNHDNSPLLQVDGNIEIKDSTLLSKKSEGLVAVNNSIITFDNVNMESNNTISSEIDNNYKSMMFYNPSNDLRSYKVIFNSKNSSLKSLNGDSFNILNVDMEINLENTEIINDNGIFLRGEKVTKKEIDHHIALNLKKQVINGDIVLDDTKSLKMKLDNSTFKGTISANKEDNDIDIILTKNSKLILTDDIYVNSLTNGDYDNKNIDLNGHMLYIDGEELSKNNIIRLDYNNETFYLILLIVLGMILGFSVIYIISWMKKIKK